MEEGIWKCPECKGTRFPAALVHIEGQEKRITVLAAQIANAEAAYGQLQDRLSRSYRMYDALIKEFSAKLTSSEAKGDRNLAERDKSEQARQQLVIEVARLKHDAPYSAKLLAERDTAIERAKRAEKDTERLERMFKKHWKIVGDGLPAYFWVKDGFERYIANGNSPREALDKAIAAMQSNPDAEEQK